LLKFISIFIFLLIKHKFLTNSLWKLDRNNHLFVEPYQLLACSNNQLQVDPKMEPEYSTLFPKSNGYYVGHACFGGMSPEMLLWAKYNTDKIGLIDDIFRKAKTRV